MFERFTDRARRVTVLAQEEAKVLGHNWIGTEHFLLGLLKEDHNAGARALKSLGLSYDGVRVKVLKIIGEVNVLQTIHIPFTPRAKNVLELALREALALRHNYIGPEHIMLAIVRQGEGDAKNEDKDIIVSVAVKVLSELQVSLESIRSAVMEALDDTIPSPKPLKSLQSVVQEVVEINGDVLIRTPGSLEGLKAAPLGGAGEPNVSLDIDLLSGDSVDEGEVIQKLKVSIKQPDGTMQYVEFLFGFNEN